MDQIHNPKPVRKILIIGASGFVGNALYESFKTTHSDSYEIMGTYQKTKYAGLHYLDVTDVDELTIYIGKNNPDYIIYAAGNKDVHACEADYSTAHAINVQPVKSLIDILKKNCCFPSHLIYISTDYVFDGIRGYYSDTDTPNPQTLYGLSKYSAEKILNTSGISYKIIRTGALMGKGGVFFDWLVHQIRNNSALTMYHDVFFTPTPISFFCEMMNKIINHYDSLNHKIIHISGEQRLSRYSFSLLIKELLHSDIIINSERKPENSLIPHDLSLISSDIINEWRARTIIEYLSDELVL